jgi:hypothetical protein
MKITGMNPSLLTFFSRLGKANHERLQTLEAASNKDQFWLTVFCFNL